MEKNNNCDPIEKYLIKLLNEAHSNHIVCTVITCDEDGKVAVGANIKELDVIATSIYSILRNTQLGSKVIEQWRSEMDDMESEINESKLNDYLNSADPDSLSDSEINKLIDIKLKDNNFINKLKESEDETIVYKKDLFSNGTNVIYANSKHTLLDIVENLDLNKFTIEKVDNPSIFVLDLPNSIGIDILWAYVLKNNIKCYESSISNSNSAR